MSGWYTPKPVVQNKGKQTSIDLSVLSRLRITLDCTPNDLLKHVLGNEDKAIRMALKGRVKTPERRQPATDWGGGLAKKILKKKRQRTEGPVGDKVFRHGAKQNRRHFNNCE